MWFVSFLLPPPPCRRHSRPAAPVTTATAAAAGPHLWRRRRPATPAPAPALAIPRRPPALLAPGCFMALSGRPSSPPSASALAVDAAMLPPPVPPAAPVCQSGKGSVAAGGSRPFPHPGGGASSSPSPPPPSPPWVRYRARVAYDGTAFCGWQSQPTGRSVQATLAVALSRRFQSPVQVVGAGRTDAGVHASGQVCHFDAPPGTDGGRLRHTLNQMLPPDVRVGIVEVAPPPRWVVLPPKKRTEPTATAVAADVVTDNDVAAAAAAADDDDAYATQALPADGNGASGSPPPAGARTLLVPWHALSCARGKRYSYRLRFGGVEDPLTSRFRAYEYRRVDVSALSAALAALVGTHDYSSFANTAASPGGHHTTSAQHNPVRTVAAAVLVAEGSHEGSAIPGAAPPAGGARDYRVDFVLDSALYKMVRNLVGAALAVATGRLSLDALVRLRDEPRMGANRFVAPARGLTLVHVLYETSFEDEVEDTAAVELLAAASASAKARATAAADGGEGIVAADGDGAWGVTAWEGAVAAATAEGSTATAEGAP